MTRLGVVFAAGGERLVAWYAGVLAGCVEAAGEELRAAGAIVGTSAGTAAAVQLAAGADLGAWADGLASRAAPASGASAVGAGAADAPTDGAALFDRLAAAYAGAAGTPVERRRALGRVAVASSPGGEEAYVAAVRRRLPTTSGWPAALRVAALDADSGERVAFGAADGVALERAMAAARSVPLLRPPVTVAGRVCIDGALASATNADLLLDAAAPQPPALAIVVIGSPADAAPGSLDALWNAALADELRALHAAGVATLVIRARAADRAAMGPDPMSGARAAEAVAAGRVRGAELAAALVARTATGTASAGA